MDIPKVGKKTVVVPDCTWYVHVIKESTLLTYIHNTGTVIF